jgi:hypothetical protein
MTDLASGLTLKGLLIVRYKTSVSSCDHLFVKQHFAWHYGRLSAKMEEAIEATSSSYTCGSERRIDM